MDYLWTPWRMNYIQTTKQTYQGCIFCHVLEMTDGPENLVILRGEYAYVIMNRYPYTSGHLMIVPYSHCAGLEDVPPEARAEVMELASQACQALRQVYRPQGFNLGMNIGEVAGAGVAEHVHLHVVPRWGGDTSFMSTVGQTRILPDALEDSYQRVRAAWPASSASPG